MSLNGVDSSNYYLIATSVNGWAESKSTYEPLISNGANISTQPVYTIGADAVPPLTSDTQDGFSITPILTTNASDLWHLFDDDWGSNSVTLGSFGSVEGHGFLMDMGVPKNIGSFKYKINQKQNSPRDYTIQGSNDGINFDVLINIVGRTTGAPYVTLTDNIASPNLYRYYMFKCTAIYLDGTNTLNLYECEFNENTITSGSNIDSLSTPNTIVQGQKIVLVLPTGQPIEHTCDIVSGSNPYIVDTTLTTVGIIPLIAYDVYEIEHEYDSLENLQVDYEFKNISAITDDIVTTSIHSTNIAASGTIQDEVNMQFTYACFDGNTAYADQSSGNVTPSTPASFVYHFNSAEVITKIGIFSGVKDYSPYNWYIEGSNDGLVWSRLFDGVATDMNVASYHEYDFDTTGSYTYYKFYCSDINTDIVKVQIREIYFYKTELASTINTLKTYDLLEDGDKLTMVKSNNEIISSIAVGVTGTNPYYMDTSGLDNGEIPIKVFRVNESIEIDGVTAVFSSDANIYDLAQDKLLTTRTFLSVPITGREFFTKIVLSAIGNKMIQLTADIWRKILA